MEVTYYGHSCFALKVGGSSLLFDPFLTGNPLAADLRIEEIPADYLLLSHGHADHIGDAPGIAERTGALVVSSFEVAEWLLKRGVERVYAMNLGGKKEWPFGVVHYVVAHHSSSLPDGSYGGSAGGFVIRTSEETVYYSGDTALFGDMKLLGEIYHPITLAILPIGDTFTMGADDAIRAAELLGCRNVMGVHYDTFEGIRIDKGAAREAFSAAELNLYLLPIGGRLTVSQTGRFSEEK
ncbi:metal-dependent hydrolase [Verrucomicrobium sp. 3C]|uniref:metal-dependent hydrolase n=1 Tax=Verrucomicrobium sp. 3C TaxID=1134055 RepID=UPI000375DA9A|nr:metal-dependent hydrolase [Verrucomicrobium sp. 3C]